MSRSTMPVVASTAADPYPMRASVYAVETSFESWHSLAAAGFTWSLQASVTEVGDCDRRLWPSSSTDVYATTSRADTTSCADLGACAAVSKLTERRAG